MLRMSRPRMLMVRVLMHGMLMTSMPLDVELEVLRFCSRVDLDKLQLVSKRKRVLVDEMSDRLALHNVRHVHKVPTDICEEILQHAIDEDKPVVPSNPNPLRRLRNAFVGTAEFWLNKEFIAAFKELLRAFTSRHKSAMKVGFVRLRSAMNG
ncbi:hypothetical protein AAVH_27421 [Aphelenchoides avenae]|nr:hypothetical protein AAVH_27421 [Aphelenchus avenae]